MIDTFRQILELCLFNQKESSNLAIIPELDNKNNPNNSENRQKIGSFYFPKQLIPENCQIKTLPDGEDCLEYLETFKQTLIQESPNRLFICSP